MNPLMQFFAYQHLPPHLQEVSKPFGDLAIFINGSLPRNPEQTVALRKLLEAKDCAVRAKLWKDQAPDRPTSIDNPSCGEPLSASLVK